MFPAMPVWQFTYWWYVLAALVIVGLAATALFFWLARQRRRREQWTALSQWARRRGFAVARAPAATVPMPMLWPALLHPAARIALRDQRTALVQLETDRTPASREPQRGSRWHLLVRQLEHNWPAAGLRPVAHARSIVDLFGLSSFPSLNATEQFVAFGGEGGAGAARALSGIAPLLPADIGLLVHGSYLIIDFSTRQFDADELSRMVALAEEVLTRIKDEHRTLNIEH